MIRETTGLPFRSLLLVLLHYHTLYIAEAVRKAGLTCHPLSDRAVTEMRGRARNRDRTTTFSVMVRTMSLPSRRIH
jgi:hypothetical protein